jgi:hypothetical protein
VALAADQLSNHPLLKRAGVVVPVANYALLNAGSPDSANAVIAALEAENIQSTTRARGIAATETRDARL